MEKSCYLGRKGIQLRQSLDSFQRYWHVKRFPEQNYSTRYRGEEDRLWFGVVLMMFRKNISYNLSLIDKSSRLCDDTKQLISRRGRTLSMWRRMGFQQQFAAIHIALIINQYLFEQNNEICWPPTVPSSPQSYRKFIGIDCCKKKKKIRRRSTVLSNFF